MLIEERREGRGGTLWVCVLAVFTEKWCINCWSVVSLSSITHSCIPISVCTQSSGPFLGISAFCEATMEIIPGMYTIFTASFSKYHKTTCVRSLLSKALREELQYFTRIYGSWRGCLVQLGSQRSSVQSTSPFLIILSSCQRCLRKGQPNSRTCFRMYRRLHAVYIFYIMPN